MSTDPGGRVAAGWYPDPAARHEYRYWGGRAWTTDCADGGRRCVDLPDVPPGAGARPRALRRILWGAYCALMLLLLVVIAPSEVAHLSSVGYLDLLLSLTAIIVLQFHAWDVYVLHPWVWKAFAVVYLAWDLTLNFFLEPAIEGTPFDPWALLAAAIVLPLWVGVFLYAFRRWPQDEDEQ